MTDSDIIECDLAFPSLASALKRTPMEFAAGYRWFQQHQGDTIANLPFGKSQPTNVDYPLARQSGIHSPSSNRMRYLDRQYAISIHSSDLDRYPDKAPLQLGDGTWVFDYSSQDNAVSNTHQDYNGWLMNCLEDGVPVGVMTKMKGGGYRVWGLAFVERYNAISKMFTLHGPVDDVTERLGRFAFTSFDDPSISGLSQVEQGTEVERRFVRRLQRYRQDLFRAKILDAYESRCAISGANVPEGLQAAHIEPYRGVRSQRTANGILLRADIHLLYDAHLLAVMPDSHIVRLSERLSDTPYRKFNGIRLHNPVDHSKRPDDSLLELQYKLFSTENRVLMLD